MQPTEGMSIARRALDVEDYIDIIRRHKGWIFGPFLFCLVASVVGVYLWPDSYLSESTVRIVPQQVPENMVQAAVNQQMTERINSMAQTILSRTVLTTIMNQYNLYPRERSRMPTEDVIEEMKKKIQITPTAQMGPGGQGRIAAFKVQFSYENRYQAQKVVADLVSRFIEENTRNRSNATYATEMFLKDQADQAKKELEEVEGKLAQFQIQNQGHLPEQMDSNMRALQALQSQIGAINSQIMQANQNKLQMEMQIRLLKDREAFITKEQPSEAIAAQQKSEKLAEADREIQALDNHLAVLRQQYTEKNPDVQTAVARLNLAKTHRDEILKEESTKKTDASTRPTTRPLTPQQLREAHDTEENIRRIEGSIQASDSQVEEFKKELAQTNEQIRAYEGRIVTVPAGAQQYADLLRERDLKKEKYMSLDQNLSKAQIAKEMEGRKQGETLELLDPASLPINNTEPKRPLIISIGAGVGLLLGIVIAGALEMKDTSLKNLKDVRAYTQMAILGSIPLLENDFVVRRRKRLAWLGWTTACLAAVVTMVGSVVYYYVTKV